MKSLWIEADFLQIWPFGVIKRWIRTILTSRLPTRHPNRMTEPAIAPENRTRTNAIPKEGCAIHHAVKLIPYLHIPRGHRGTSCTNFTTLKGDTRTNCGDGGKQFTCNGWNFSLNCKRIQHREVVELNESSDVRPDKQRNKLIGNGPRGLWKDRWRQPTTPPLNDSVVGGVSKTLSDLSDRTVMNSSEGGFFSSRSGRSDNSKRSLKTSIWAEMWEPMVSQSILDRRESDTRPESRKPQNRFLPPLRYQSEREDIVQVRRGPDRRGRLIWR
ncbi:hypothetical protein CPB86DRAFT_821707 [Serendipita vermifera]|nr:hypothetical protein CPB86DRAFT_821707 [Serendipita vermifera]